jgi:hypothetical protein
MSKPLGSGGIMPVSQIIQHFPMHSLRSNPLIYCRRPSMSCLEMSEDPDYFQVFYVSKYF